MNSACFSPNATQDLISTPRYRSCLTIRSWRTQGRPRRWSASTGIASSWRSRWSRTARRRNYCKNRGWTLRRNHLCLGMEIQPLLHLFRTPRFREYRHRKEAHQLKWAIKYRMDRLASEIIVEKSRQLIQGLPSWIDSLTTQQQRRSDRIRSRQTEENSQLKSLKRKDAILQGRWGITKWSSKTTARY